MQKLQIVWCEIKTIHKEGVLHNHIEVLRKELGTLKGIKAVIALKPDHRPRFCQVIVVPYALRSKIEAEINLLCEQGIVFPVKFSNWATSIVPVVRTVMYGFAVIFKVSTLGCVLGSTQFHQLKIYSQQFQVVNISVTWSYLMYSCK